MKDLIMESKTHDVKVLFYVTLLGPLSIALFLYGFFPLINYNNKVATVDDIPKFVENIRVKTDSLYQPVVKKLIVMIIDALRWDFITGPFGKVAMPITSTLIANSSACLLQSKVQPPTVTMPRIKAITSGTVPSFIDIALNFGSKPVSSDNILLQAKKHGHKLIFYGDETWPTIFPSLFDRYDATTSFIVTDFTEVDNNVTRHINRELNNQSDWSIMILHYLGLDHIGHVHGPFSPLIKTKLKEMDDIITELQLKIQEWNRNGDSSLLIICGDHGMKDSGGHGGSTIAETIVPFIAIGSKCFQSYNEPMEIAQIDIASTMAIILGIPIPFSNLGTTFVDTLYDFPISKRLFILHYNAKQVFNHFQKLTDYDSQYAYQKYSEALKLHVAWLNTKDQSNEMTDDIVQCYLTALKEMKRLLISSMIKYDTYVITIAIFFLCHVFCIITGTQYSKSFTFWKILIIILLNITLWLMINYFWESEGISLFYSKDITTIVLTLVIAIILFTNCYLLANTKYTFWITLKTGNGTMDYVYLAGAFIHGISLCGSSFVEEEHQTWYFYFVTVLAILLYQSATRFFQQLQFYRNYKQCSYAQICIKLLLLLIAHRVLRKLNSTGDKYAYLPDIAGWLTEQESTIGMTILLITALALLTWIGYKHEDTKCKQQSLVFYVGLSTCIYLRHMRNNTVVEVPLSFVSRVMHEVQIFWVLLFIYSIQYIYRFLPKFKYNKFSFLKNTLSLMVQIWIIITAMLHQPYNVILLPCQIIFSNVIRTIVLREYNSYIVATLVYAWCGNVFYFYQGNSNSLATIDVAAGYVGIQSYMPLINGAFLLFNTYSAPVLAYLLLTYHAVLQYPYHAYETIIQTSKMYATWRLLPVTMYTVIISIQRHHLFVWSVFSPKLLYEAVHSAIICLVTLILLSIAVLGNLLNNYNR